MVGGLWLLMAVPRTPPPYHRNPLRAVGLRLSSVIFFIVGGLFSEIALRKKWGAVAGRISSEGVDDWDVWCLLFVFCLLRARAKA